ncbi:MAG: hypothetical protein IT306_28370 [Chloroflexi bacterium]|nr:hypothetical protein [Chloroflexota bacterium]
MLSIVDDSSAERFVARRASGWRQQESAVVLELEGAREPDRTDIAAVLAGARLNDALDRAELAIMVLESGAVRLQFGAPGTVPFERDLGLLNPDELEIAPLGVTTTESGVHVASERYREFGPDPEDVTVEVVFDPFNLTVLNAGGEIVVRLAGEPPEPPAGDDDDLDDYRPSPLAWIRRTQATPERVVTASFALDPEERLFGLGARAGRLNLVGTRQEVGPLLTDAETEPAAAAAEGRSTEGRSVEGRSVEGRSTEGRSTEGRSTEGRSTEGRSETGGSGHPEATGAVVTRPPFLLSSRGYGLLIHGRAGLTADLGQGWPDEYTLLVPDADLDLFLFPAGWPRTSLSGYARLTGQVEQPEVGAFAVRAGAGAEEGAGAWPSGASAASPAPRSPDEMRATLQRVLSGGLVEPGFWRVSLAGLGTASADAPTVPAASTALTARWVQLALLAPLVGGDLSGVTGPLAEIVRAYTALRHRLLPYFLHAAHETAEVGLPMLRPLLLEHAWDPDAVEIDDQMLLGRDVLLAPIFSDLASPVTRRVYLPGYANWYDWWTGLLYEGRQWIETTAPLDRLPIYVRAGTAVPLADPREMPDQGPAPVTRLLLFAPRDGAIGSSIDLADDELMGVEQERGDRKARLYLEGIPPSIRDLEIVGLPARVTLVDASSPAVALTPSDGILPGLGAHWSSITVRLEQGAFTAGLELSW